MKPKREIRGKASVDMYLLDAIADDIEQFSDVIERLNGDRPTAWWRYRGALFGHDEVVEGLSRLIQNDWARVYLLTPGGDALIELAPRALPPSSYTEAWFKITPRGILAHSAWNPPRRE
ncbi:MAG: hypothetical protein AB7Q69_03315 [Gemmatimonadales bacterium]